MAIKEIKIHHKKQIIIVIVKISPSVQMTKVDRK